LPEPASDARDQAAKLFGVSGKTVDHATPAPPCAGAVLLAVIAEHGQRLPIATFQGQIIDGRNRYRACTELGIEPQFEEWDGQGSLVAFVASLNLNRRHLTASQRAAVGADMLPMLEEEAKERQRAAGGDRKSGAAKSLVPKMEQPIPPPKRAPSSVETAGKIVGVGKQYVSDAKKLKASSPELAEKVKAGELSLSQAKAEAGPKLYKATSRMTGPKVADDDPPAEERKSRRVGVTRANQAIDVMKSIPRDDALRETGFTMVANWVASNADVRYVPVKRRFRGTLVFRTAASEIQEWIQRMELAGGVKTISRGLEDHERWELGERIEKMATLLFRRAAELRRT
jgi:hypothetical protein